MTRVRAFPVEQGLFAQKGNVALKKGGGVVVVAAAAVVVLVVVVVPNRLPMSSAQPPGVMWFPKHQGPFVFGTKRDPYQRSIVGNHWVVSLRSLATCRGDGWPKDSWTLGLQKKGALS